MSQITQAISAKNNRQKRLNSWLLFNCLTIALAALFSSSGCRGPLNNDVSKDVVPGSESAYDSSLPAGAVANEIVGNRHFPALLVEIQPVKGFTLSQESLNQLRAFLLKHVSKPKGIRIEVDAPINAPSRTSGIGYTLLDLKRIENLNRRHYNRRGLLTLYVLALDGSFEGDSTEDKVLGVSYQNLSSAIFMHSLRSATERAAHPEYAEATVLLHEIGHQMGLVGMDDKLRPHEDPVHHSCTNSKCLMNHAAESSAAIVDFTKDQIPELDADCEKDLTQTQ